jgi:BASS family bile acid:Na+ symporter
VLLAVVIPLASFTTGLQAPKASGTRLWRRPSLLLRALLAILIAVPLWALLLVAILPLAPVAKGGILIAVLAVGIGPVAGMKRMAGTVPHARDAMDLNIVVLILSLAFVPIAFAGLAAALHRDVHVGAGQVAKVLLGKALVPMVLGLGVAHFAPSFARRAGAPLAKIINIVLLLVLVVALLATWRGLVGIGAKGWLACVATALGAVVIGHLLGGPDDGTRGVVASASTLRFPALGLVLASVTAEPKRMVPVVLAYVIAALAAVTVYGRVMARRARRRSGAQPVEIPAAASPRPA